MFKKKLKYILYTILYFFGIIPVFSLAFICILPIISIVGFITFIIDIFNR